MAASADVAVGPRLVFRQRKLPYMQVLLSAPELTLSGLGITVQNVWKVVICQRSTAVAVMKAMRATTAIWTKLQFL